MNSQLKKTEFITNTYRYGYEQELMNSLLEKKSVKNALKRFEKVYSGYGLSSTRNLYAHSVRLYEDLNPDLFNLLEDVKEVLSFDEPVKIFICQSAHLNAFCLRDGMNTAVVGLTSQLIKTFSSDEIKFVLGHELGHLIHEHYKIPMPLTAQIADYGGKIVSLEEAIELYIWSRSAEITADRCGLIAASNPGASINALYKLSSGLENEVTIEQAEKYLVRLDAFAFTPSSRPDMHRDDMSMDCFQTHPFSPLRIKALLTFQSFLNQDNKDFYDLKNVDDEVLNDLKLMEPSYLEQNTKEAKALKRLLTHSGYKLIESDGEIKDIEIKALETLVGKNDVDLVKTQSPEFREKEYEKTVENVNSVSNQRNKLKVLMHLVIIMACDSDYAKEELDYLKTLASELSLDVHIIDEILNSFKEAMD